MTWTTRAHDLRTAQAEILADTLRSIDPDDPILTRPQLDPRSGEGDKHRMRMIPINAIGVGGTIPGTDPLAATISRERWRTDR